MKKKIITYLVLVIVGLGIILTVLGINGVLSGDAQKEDIVRFVCDSFFVAGVVVGGIGLLILVSNKGAFDGLKYSVTSLFRLHFSTKRYDWQEKESYGDYQERMREKTKGDRSFVPFLVVGGVCIFVSIIMLIVYYTA